MLEAAMNVSLVIILTYLFVTLIIGIIVYKRSGRSSVEFFLAGRNVPKVLLFFTMAATNFSAFTIFGLSGAGYRMGYAFYPVMGFGTGFMALSMWIIGSRIAALAGNKGYITPSDFIMDRYGSLWLKKIVSVIMIVFTLPYLSLQAMAAGSSILSMTGLPYVWGAFLVTIFVVLYVFFGGMRSVVLTDLIQAIMMVGLTLAGFILIARRSGGFVSTHALLLKESPGHFMRPGTGSPMTPGVWIGYMVLWFVSVPMAPQLFQRYMAVKSPDKLRTTLILYPLITTFLFFLTVSIGVMGRVVLPGISAAQSDSIYPRLLSLFASPPVSAVILMGGLAALMSTMSSQLLTLASLTSIDIFPGLRRSVFTDRLIVLGLGVLGFLIALKPPETLLSFISATTFNGLSVLFPVVIGGLFWKGASKEGAFACIGTGETLVVLYYFKLLPTFGLLPVIPIVIVAGLVYVLVSLAVKGEAPAWLADLKPRRPGAFITIFVFVVLFLGTGDFWNWGRTPRIIAGLPVWVVYYAGLGIVLSAAYAVFIRPNRD